MYNQIDVTLLLSAVQFLIDNTGKDPHQPGLRLEGSIRFRFNRAAQFRRIGDHLARYPLLVSHNMAKEEWASFDESMASIERMPVNTASRRRREILAEYRKRKADGYTTMSIDVRSFRK